MGVDEFGHHTVESSCRPKRVQDRQPVADTDYGFISLDLFISFYAGIKGADVGRNLPGSFWYHHFSGNDFHRLCLRQSLLSIVIQRFY